MTRSATSTTNGKREARPKAAARTDQLRPLNLPRPVEVTLDGAGLPVVVADIFRPFACPPVRPEPEEECSEPMRKGLAGKPVESIIEIWHVDDEWWREPISRRCVEVILEGGKHVVLYEDLTTNDWFMQRP